MLTILNVDRNRLSVLPSEVQCMVCAFVGCRQFRVRSKALFLHGFYW